MKSRLFQGSHWARSLVPALAFIIFSSVLPAWGTTLIVAKTGSDTATCGSHEEQACLTIQYAIDNRAVAGDVIEIRPGTYSELITIGKNLTLIGSERTIIDGMQKGTVVTVNFGITAKLALLTIQNGLFAITQPNQLATGAGGINNNGTLTLLEVLLTHNQVSTSTTGYQLPLAGGIFNNGTLTAFATNIVANTGTGGCSTAGGIYNSGPMTIDFSLFSENTVATGPGGCVGPGTIPDADGLYNSFSTAEVERTSFWRNGIVNNGNLTVSQSTVSRAVTGIYNALQLVVVNSTISGNATGIYNAISEHSGILNMSSSTVARNAGDGVSLGPPIASTIRNSILAENGGLDCDGSFISGDYNLIQNFTGCSFVGGGHDVTGVAAKLGPLGFNGGPTETMVPQTGSPAITDGNPNGCTDSAGNLLHVDQRDFPRPAPGKGICTIGSVQVEHFKFW
jgi:hypothetical protein